MRLTQGDYNQAERYDADPVETVRGFVAAGARRIHLVDLDAARGQGHNRAVLARLRAAIPADVIVEVGGGIRSVADIEELRAAGVDRLVLGTVLAKDPDTVAAWTARYGACFVAGIDARDGEVKVAGWETGSGLRDLDLARRCRDLGLVSIIYTNIARDGTLGGADVESTRRVAEASGLPLILSGGVAGLADVAAAAAAGLAGCITGKALYKGTLDLAEAIRLYQTPTLQEVIW